MNYRTVALLVAVGGTTACNSGSPEPDYALYPKRLELAPTAWVDANTKWYSVAVLNQTYFELTLSDVEVIGAGADFLQLRPPNVAKLGLRQSTEMQVRVIDPSASGATGWSTGEYEAELRFRVSGSGKLDPETFLPDPAALVTVDQSVPIRFSLACDLDLDGADATACGGNDCNDELDAVGPLAVEYCDGFDNNCNNVVDDDCVGED